jgi:hypothetical protein
MKRFNVFLGALLTAVVIAACAPAFEPGLETNYTRQKENTALRYFQISLATTPVLTVQPSSGTIDTQTIVIDTNAFFLATGASDTLEGFNLVIDETTKKIPGLEVYTVEGTSGSAMVRHQTALAYTAVPTDRDTVELRLPFTRNVVSTDTVVLVVDPATVRFNGEGKLNTDGDTEPGESEEDIYIEYLAVTDNPAIITSGGTPLTAVTGMFYMPPVGNALTPPTAPSTTGIATATERLSVVGGTKLQIGTFADNAGSNGNFDGAALTRAYKFQRFDHAAKNWVDVTPTGDLNTTTGVLTLTFPAASLYDFYRYQVDLYQIVEKDAVQNYKHRVSYDQKKGYASGTGVAGAWTILGFTTDDSTTPVLLPSGTYIAVPGGIAGQYYLDVTVPNISGGNYDADLIASTLTPANIQVVYYELGPSDPSTNSYGEVALTDASFEKLGPREFRIKMPSSFAPSSVSTARASIWIHDVQISYTTGSGSSLATVSGVKLFNRISDGTVTFTASANF